MGEFNKTLALATAIGSLGGFQMAPEWFLNLSRYSVFQILVLAILLWQGGGGGGDGNPFMWSVMFAVAFWGAMKASSYIRVRNTSAPLSVIDVVNEASGVKSVEEKEAEEEEEEVSGENSEEAPAGEASGETFLGNNPAEMLARKQLEDAVSGNEAFRGFGQNNNYATF